VSATNNNNDYMTQWMR